MNPRDRNFGPIASLNPDGSLRKVDVGSLVRRLVLFEHCLLESMALREIPVLIQVLGYEGLMALLNDPHFEIICDGLTAGSIGQTGPLRITEERGGTLPLGSFRIVTIAREEGPYRFEGDIQIVDSLDLSSNRKKKLKAKLLSKLTTYSREAGRLGVEDFHSKLMESPSSFIPIIKFTAKQEFGIEIDDEIQIRAEDLVFDRDFQVDTNLSSQLGIDSHVSHKILEKALLAQAGMSQRMRFMENFNAVTGFQETELPVFEAHLNFLQRLIDPIVQEQRFSRIVELGELPSPDSISTAHRIDVRSLLELRDSMDVHEMRRWLRGIDSDSDVEVIAQFHSVKERMRGIFAGNAVQAFRFLVTTGVSLAPTYGSPLGVGASLADQFLLDRFVKRPGPVTFLSKNYASIYKPNDD